MPRDPRPRSESGTHACRRVARAAPRVVVRRRPIDQKETPSRVSSFPAFESKHAFDVLPALPAPSGIIGVVGIADLAPADGGLVSVTKLTELRDVLGPGDGGFDA